MRFLIIFPFFGFSEAYRKRSANVCKNLNEKIFGDENGKIGMSDLTVREYSVFPTFFRCNWTIRAPKDKSEYFIIMEALEHDLFALH